MTMLVTMTMMARWADATATSHLVFQGRLLLRITHISFFIIIIVIIIIVIILSIIIVILSIIIVVVRIEYWSWEYALRVIETTLPKSYIG